MSYEFQVNSNVTGLDKVQALGQETEKQVDRTKKLDSAVQEYLKSHDKLIKQQDTYAGQQAKIAELTEKYWDQQSAALRKLAAAQDAAAKEAEKRASAESKAADDAAAAYRRMAAAHDAANKENERRNQEMAGSIKNWIQHPLEEAGNAVEQFALKYGAVGMAAVGVSAGFAVAAAGAFNLAQHVAEAAHEAEQLSIRTGLSIEGAQLFSRTAEVAGVNAGALTTAMRTLSRGMSDNSEEGKKQRETLHDLGVQVYEVSTGALRSMDQILPEILQKLRELPNVADRNTAGITLLGRAWLELSPLVETFDKLSQRVKDSGVIISKEGVEAADKYRVSWALVKLELEGVINDLGLIAAKGISSVMGTGRPSMRSPGMAAMVAEEEAEDARGGMFGQMAQQRRIEANNAAVRLAMTSSPDDTKDRLAVAKSQLKELQSRLKLGVEQSVNQPTFEKIEKKKEEIALIEAETKATKELATARERATKELATARERVTEMVKRGDVALAAAHPSRGITDDYTSALSKISIEYADAIRKNPQASLRGRIDQAFGEEAEAATIVARRKSQESEKQGAQIMEEAATSAETSFKKLEATVKALGNPEIRDLVESMDPSTSRARLRQGVPPPPGYVSPGQRLRDFQDSSRRQMSQLGLRGRLAGESEGAMVGDQYGMRVSQAEQEHELQLEKISADNKLNEAQKEIARDDAREARHQKLFDADMERENALLEIALKQKEEFQSIAVGFMDAARSGGSGIASFMKGQLNKMEDTIVANLAGMAAPTIEKAMGGLHTSGTLGKILQGTPFGADPMKSAGQTLNTAGVGLNRAAMDLSAAARSLAMSRTGGGGGSVPGFGGGGGAGSGGFGEEDTVYGMPSADPGSGDFGGEYGAQVSVPGGKGIASGISKGIGYAAAGAAVYQGVTTMFKGGGKNIAGGISEIAMTAAVMDPEPISKAVLAGVAFVSSMVSSLFGDPKADRSAAIQNRLMTSQFYDPVKINAAMTTGGGFSDFDRFGGTRGSSLSPFPTIEEPFAEYRYNVTVPGRTVSQFGGGPSITIVMPAVTAMDGHDVSRVLNAHLPVVGDVVSRALETGHAPRMQELMGHR